VGFLPRVGLINAKSVDPNLSWAHDELEAWDAVTFEGPCSKRTKSHLKKLRPPSGTEMTKIRVFGIDVKIFVEFDVGW
jgi:hypothetical protein